MSEHVMVVAELGLNHGGSLDTALRMVDAAAASGCDAVKVQVFDAEEFCSPSATYKGEKQADMFKRYELDDEQLFRIYERTQELRIPVIATVTSRRSIERAAMLKPWAYKIGSDDINNLPLLRGLALWDASARKVLSTGMATSREINAAVAILEPAYVLHCVSLYPCPAHLANLRRMAGVHMFGFSDHTEGHEAAIAAVALGARMIEKHFTLDRSLPGPDHAFSETPESMAALVKSVRRVEAMLGDGLVDPQPEEIRMRYTARRFAVAARSMVAGTRLALADIAAKRCAADHMCFEPPEIPELVGRILVRARVEGEPIRVGDLE